MAADSSPDFDRTDISPMVPSDDDSIVSKRKETTSHELEGSRRKKKKKQGGTPRPACSWVHFSREFIKEYSASHPESSGLKVATKAASDAWKVMSLEEKEKYTKRAREVWDDYLSSAPAREPKPRKQANLVTRCSPGRLVNVIKRFTPDQKEAVKSMGFGSLLDLKCRTLRRSLCLWLLERFNTIRRSLEICGKRIPLSPRDVELVMGLPASGKDVVNSGPDDLVADLRQKYNASNRGISVRFLEERLGDPEAGDDFKRAFLLYVLGTLLCPTARLDVSPSFLHFLTDMDSIHEYNWAKFLLDKLVREVSRFRQGKQRAVGGCLLFLQLFYYESVAIGGPCELGPVVVPCLSLWTEENISEREKQEKELGGYGSGEVICKERGLGLSLFIEKAHVDVLPLREVAVRANRSILALQEKNLGSVAITYEDESTLPTKIEGYGYNNTMDYSNMNDHNDVITYGESTCPLPSCNFTGLFEHLSDHFSMKHWDSGRRFQYNCPLPVSLGMDETFLVLQAEEDGLLFLLNKGTENIGHTVMVTCIGPSSSNERFLYYLVSERGSSSLRLKSYTQNLPGESLQHSSFFCLHFHPLLPEQKMSCAVEIKKTFDQRSERVKSVDLHPTKPWVLSALHSGNVCIWNYRSQVTEKSFEITKSPVRTAKFIAHKEWIVTGADDGFIRVYNYNTMESVVELKAHTDYIRSVVVHPSLSHILSASDDKLIKLWNWENDWECVQTFPGHDHYVMQVAFNPRDTKVFASASLDCTIKTWNLGYSSPRSSIKGHLKGLNSVEFLNIDEKLYLVSGSDDFTVKVWDYETETCVQTLEGHTNNVTSILCVNSDVDYIITGFEDGTVRIWNAKTYNADHVFASEIGRVWTIGFVKDSAQIILGCDEGTIIGQVIPTRP